MPPREFRLGHKAAEHNKAGALVHSPNVCNAALYVVDDRRMVKDRPRPTTEVQATPKRSFQAHINEPQRKNYSDLDFSTRPSTIESTLRKSTHFGEHGHHAERRLLGGRIHVATKSGQRWKHNAQQAFVGSDEING
jgi:hypothetical protein